MKRFGRIGLFIAALTLSVFSGAFANVGPMVEGGSPVSVSRLLILVGVFIIDPEAYKKPLSWIAAIFFFNFYILCGGPFPLDMVLPALIYFTIKAVQLIRYRVSVLSKLVRISIIAFLVLFLFFSMKFANESSIHYFYNRGHEELSRLITETADKIEDYRENDINKLYPDEEIFITKIYSEPAMFYSIKHNTDEPATLRYEPSKDRKSFVLRYSGDYFNKNPWYMLPPGYPLYRSGKGIEAGERIPYWDAFFKRKEFSGNNIFDSSLFCVGK